MRPCILFHRADFEVRRHLGCETSVACFSGTAASGFQDAVSLALPDGKGGAGPGTD